MESKIGTASHKSSDENIALRLWDGDETVLAELAVEFGPQLEIALKKKYGICSEDAEDSVAAGILCFWKIRDRYDPSRSLRAFLYRIVDRIALKHKTGHLKWQMQRNRERIIDPDLLAELVSVNEQVETGTKSEPSKEHSKIVQDAISTLSETERKVLVAYADAGDKSEIDSTKLGIKLGLELNGIPIPGGTIRQQKKRAIEKMKAELTKRGYNPQTGTFK